MNNPLPMRRLPLVGTQNTRDLGGYACTGGATRWGVFLRSDNPSRVTAQDIAYLRSYGVTTVVDLRRDKEGEWDPSALVGQEGFAVHQISMNDELHKLDYEGDLPGSMAGLYRFLLDNAGGAIAKTLGVMAKAEGGVLFHCAVGKDRTGVIAMLLLKLVGVADEDVVADYAVTDVYKREAFAAQSKVFGKLDIPEHVLRSRPKSMQRTLRHLHEEYGTARQYLEGIGLSAQHIHMLEEKLVQGGPAAP